MESANRLAALAAGLAALACTPRPSDLGGRLDESLARGVEFLAGRQDPDGAWRSETYGALREGWSLTPPVAKTLLFAPTTADRGRSVERAIEWLCAAVGDDGTIETGPIGMAYPVYSASLTAVLLTRGAGSERRGAREAWLGLLRSHQLDEDLGWGPTDPPYGGWGYSILPPEREDALRLGAYDSDLSSTLFALGALRLSGTPADAPEVRRALLFVQRCQNLPLEGHLPDPRFDDGGFFFAPMHPLQNKAGPAGTDGNGRVRHRSYGSATADGLRALLRCGLSADDPRVLAARDWLAAHLDVTLNPGEFADERAGERDAAYYYWCWSLAHSLHALNVDELETPGGRVAWVTLLADELMRRQRADGSWSNPDGFVKEDDPLIATSLAAGALGICRMRLELAGP